MPDLNEMFDENRDKVEQAAEKGVDVAEQRTGHQAPDAVDDRIDQIDPTDGDGGPGGASGAPDGATGATDGPAGTTGGGDEQRTPTDRTD